MDKRELAKITRRVKTLQRQLGQLGPVMRGSVVALGPKKEIKFSLNKNGRTRLIYLGEKRAPRAREYSENYRKLQAIVEEMTELNMTLLRKDYGMEVD